MCRDTDTGMDMDMDNLNRCNRKNCSKSVKIFKLKNNFNHKRYCPAKTGRGSKMVSIDRPSLRIVSQLFYFYILRELAHSIAKNGFRG
jgi:hypothetical protein